MARLDDLLAEVLDDDADALGEDTPFSQCAGWDSLKHVQLIVGLESRFGIELEAEEISRMTDKRSARAVLASRGVDA